MSVATPSQPRSPTSLDYVDPHPEPSHEPEGNPVDDNGSTYGPDGPDSAPDPGDPDDNNNRDDPDNPPQIPTPINNHPEGDRFIKALMHLSGSLKDL